MNWSYFLEHAESNIVFGVLNISNDFKVILLCHFTDESVVVLLTSADPDIFVLEEMYSDIMFFEVDSLVLLTLEVMTHLVYTIVPGWDVFELANVEVGF